VDEPFLVFDFDKITEMVKTEEVWKKGDRNALTLLKNSFMTVVLICIKSNEEINFHHAGELANIQILEGKVNFKTNNTITSLKKGGLLTLHEQVEHMLTTVEESVILLTMTMYPADPI
jgi:quercetin dioxygenase-like cupin family protein